MRNKAGVLLMILGTALIFGALFLFISNQREAMRAGQAVDEVLPQLIEVIEQNEETAEPSLPHVPPSADVEEGSDSSEPEMSGVLIDGYDYIGYLSIPRLGLDLPVIDDWDYTKLQSAPCRYAGSIEGEDMVIMAHNYVRHFGGLSNLSEGDSVIFTDIGGNTVRYRVAAQDVLPETASEEMTAGVYPLTLFTCTYSGSSRITVYCDREEN